MFLFEKENRFNIANLVTYLNVALGVVSIYFITQENFFTAIILAWLAGACDIIDGKLARGLNLSTPYGVQLDSFADFITFVVMPPFLLFYKLKSALHSNLEEALLGAVFLIYIIAGLKRLIEFNLATDAGSVQKFFVGVPTPLGAILLWVLYLLFSYGVITNVWTIAVLVLAIAYAMNSKIKIPHP